MWRPCPQKARPEAHPGASVKTLPKRCDGLRGRKRKCDRLAILMRYAIYRLRSFREHALCRPRDFSILCRKGIIYKYTTLYYQYNVCLQSCAFTFSDETPSDVTICILHLSDYYYYIQPRDSVRDKSSANYLRRRRFIDHTIGTCYNNNL